MKIMQAIKALLILTIFLSFTFCTSKSDDENKDTSAGKFPVKFSVEIPSSLSKAYTNKSASNDFSGKQIYQHLNNFIYVGESAAHIVEDIMVVLSQHNLDHPMEFTYISTDDNKTKKLVVVNNVNYEEANWQNLLTISDVASTNNTDKGIALKVYWNTNPVNGIAILKPANWDATFAHDYKNTMYKIAYSEDKSNGYDQSMEVSIANWEEMLSDRFHMDQLKMFVGKKGDIIDIYGNSNHPDAYLFLEEPKGFNWAFVASANAANNIAVAEVGLPASTLNSNDRTIILKNNSIKNVFSEQISDYILLNYQVVPTQVMIDELLLDTEAPGFFNSQGFIQGGTAPSENFVPLIDNIEKLSPYNPLIISTQSISIN